MVITPTKKQLVFLERLLGSNAISQEVREKTLARMDGFDRARVNQAITYCQRMIRDRDQAIKNAGGIKGIYKHLLDHADKSLKKGVSLDDGYWFLVEEAARHIGVETEALPNKVTDKVLYVAERFYSAQIFTSGDRQKSLEKRRAKTDEVIAKIRHAIEMDLPITDDVLRYQTRKGFKWLKESAIKRHLSNAEMRDFRRLQGANKARRDAEIRDKRHNEGWTIKEIANVYRVSVRTVYYVLSEE